MSTEKEEQEIKGCYDAGFKAGIEAGMAITVERCLNAAPKYEGNVADYSWAIEAYQRNIRALYPSRCPPVPDSLIGNILDHWELIPGDAKQELKDELSGFYTAMQRLTDWIEENR